MEIDYTELLPSMIKARNKIKSFDVFEQFLIIGSENAEVEIHDWIEEKKLLDLNLQENDSNYDSLVVDHGQQVINLSIFNQNQTSFECLVQLRKGKVFLLSFNKADLLEKNGILDMKNYLKQIIETGSETFTKFLIFKIESQKSQQFRQSEEIINQQERESSIQLYNNISESLVLLYPSEKENLLNLVSIETSCGKYIIKDEIPVIVNPTEQQEEEENLEFKETGSISVIAKHELFSYIFIAQENLRISVLDSVKEYSFITGIRLDQMKQILTIKIIVGKEKISDTLFLIVGGFHSEVIILRYKGEKLEIISLIKNACSDIKPGISSIDYYSYKLSESFLVTGSFDYRIRLYLRNNDEYKFLGWRRIDNYIIHQVKFVAYSDSLYLLVASEQNMILVYLIK